MDCGEFPCILVVRRSAISESTCEELGPFRVATPDEAAIEADVGQGWDGWVPYDTENLASDSGRFGARYRARFRHRAVSVLARLHRHQSDTSQEIAIGQDCAVYQEFLDSVPSCDGVRELWGCSADPPHELTVDSFAAHREEAVQIASGLERECDRLSFDSLYIDCTDLPCIVAAQLPKDEPVLGATCDHWATRSHTLYLNSPDRQEMVAVMPMLELASSEMGDSWLLHWEETRDARVFRLLDSM